MKTILTLFIAICAPLSLKAEEPLAVVVSVPPLLKVVEAIGGDAVNAWSFLPGGSSCGSFQPTPRDVARLAGAEMFFACGVDYEQRAAPRLRGQFPTMTWIDLREGLTLRRANGVWDAHWWLDFDGLAKAAARIEAEFSARRPERAADFAAGRAVFEAELARLATELEATLDGIEGNAFLVYHGAWGYPADRFGLRQLILAPTAAGSTPRRVQTLLAEMAVDAPLVVMIQPQEPHGPAEVLARTLDVPLLECDPLQPDFAAALRCWAAALRARSE